VLVVPFVRVPVLVEIFLKKPIVAKNDDLKPVFMERKPYLGSEDFH
jgi:hypothetical protein